MYRKLSVKYSHKDHKMQIKWGNDELFYEQQNPLVIFREVKNTIYGMTCTYAMTSRLM